jgi:hypothetical protein
VRGSTTVEGKRESVRERERERDVRESNLPGLLNWRRRRVDTERGGERDSQVRE